MNPSQTLHISADDNVVVALRMIAGGTVVDGVTVASEVPAGHKIAMRVIRAGEIVLKYGYPIGVATRDIAPGEHVHSHNLASTLREDFDPSKRAGRQRPFAAALEAATFDGFRRADGRVGVRNEIWIVNTVGCVNNAAERIAAAARAELGARHHGRRRERLPAPVRLLAARRGPGADAADPRWPGPPPQRGRRADPGARLREQPDEAAARAGGRDRARPRRVLQRSGRRRRGRGGAGAHPQARRPTPARRSGSRSPPRS